MGRYKLLIKPSARKELDQLPRDYRRLIIGRIEDLQDNPRPFGSIKLAGQSAYRIRQGAYRVVYTVDDGERLIRIMKVGHRREIYR